MNTGLIRNTIQLAKRHEERSSLLIQQLQLASADTHHCIELPQQGAAASSLYDFALKYVELIPDLFEYTLAAAEKGNILELVQTYLNLVSGYFLAPKNSASVGMIELLNEAYLVHRLIEELNDQIEFVLGVPLVHFDMMQANLIIRHMIGESFANELDKVATVMVDKDKVLQALSEAQLDADWIKSLRESRRAVSGAMVFCFAEELGARLGGCPRTD